MTIVTQEDVQPLDGILVRSEGNAFINLPDCQKAHLLYEIQEQLLLRKKLSQEAVRDGRRDVSAAYEAEADALQEELLGLNGILDALLYPDRMIEA